MHPVEFENGYLSDFELFHVTEIILKLNRVEVGHNPGRRIFELNQGFVLFGILTMFDYFSI